MVNKTDQETDVDLQNSRIQNAEDQQLENGKENPCKPQFFLFISLRVISGSVTLYKLCWLFINQIVYVLQKYNTVDVN